MEARRTSTPLDNSSQRWFSPGRYTACTRTWKPASCRVSASLVTLASCRKLFLTTIATDTLLDARLETSFIDDFFLAGIVQALHDSWQQHQRVSQVLPEARLFHGKCQSCQFCFTDIHATQILALLPGCL